MTANVTHEVMLTNKKCVNKQQQASFGLTDDHITYVDNIGLHKDVLEPWQQLVDAARKAGFDLALASGFRSFDRQQYIWNAKMCGERPVLDDDGCISDVASLSSLDKIKRIMRWSALPGTSRHHWGTDVDVYDRASVPDNYCPQLVANEYIGNGPFAPMSQWLKEFLSEADSPAFMLPYTEDNNGIKPEPWHLSYLPVAKQYQTIWSLELLQKHLNESDIIDKTIILSSIDALYEQFIKDSINPMAANVKLSECREKI
jgi:LAS superfamily LD-carboxypeptidase LdcB